MECRSNRKRRLRRCDYEKCPKVTCRNGQRYEVARGKCCGRCVGETPLVWAPAFPFLRRAPPSVRPYVFGGAILVANMHGGPAAMRSTSFINSLAYPLYAWGLYVHSVAK